MSTWPPERPDNYCPDCNGLGYTDHECQRCEGSGVWVPFQCSHCGAVVDGNDRLCGDCLSQQDYERYAERGYGE